MANLFSFNGVSSASFGLHIQSKQIFDAPVLEQTLQTVPGRDGDILLKGNRLQNVSVSYTCFFKENNITDLASQVRRIKAWLYSSRNQYAILTDSYDPAYFRYALLREAVTIDEQFNKLGLFTVTFTCLPYKYSIDGQTEVSAANKTLTVANPESFDALPVIKVTGTGAFTLTVSGTGYACTVAVANTGSTSRQIIFDSSRMLVYADAALLTSLCTFSSGFPVLKPGSNTVRVTGSGVTALSVTPGWRTL